MLHLIHSTHYICGVGVVGATHTMRMSTCANIHTTTYASSHRDPRRSKLPSKLPTEATDRLSRRPRQHLSRARPRRISRISRRDRPRSWRRSSRSWRTRVIAGRRRRRTLPSSRRYSRRILADVRRVPPDRPRGHGRPRGKSERARAAEARPRGGGGPRSAQRLTMACGAPA